MVRRPRVRRTEGRRREAREEHVRRAEQVLIGEGHEVVVRSIDRPKAHWELRVEGDILRPDQLAERYAGGVALADYDLLKDEPQVAGVEDESIPDWCGLRVHWLWQERGSEAEEKHRENHDQRQSLLCAEFSQREHSILLAGSSWN